VRACMRARASKYVYYGRKRTTVAYVCVCVARVYVRGMGVSGYVAHMCIW